MSISRVIEVSFGGGSIAYVKADTVYFYNNGIIFKPTDIDLPASYQVHWADSPQSSSTLETIGTAEGAPIPDDLWNRSRVIYGWIYLHPTEDSGVTAYEVRIYKNVRAGLPDGTEPTPSEHSTIDQLISAMNTAADKAEQNADSASSDADRAETARNEAETYATNAQTSASNAEASATTATNQAQIATTSATTATTAAQTATTKATEASDSASSAAESASSASDSADSASRSEQAAKVSETNAADSESNASTYANSARGYAQTAQSASASASSSATSASNSANSASNSATSASQSASIATEAKADIEGMVESARGYANASATNATSASRSADQAESAATNAATFATNAGNKAVEAAQSANTASSKATEASTSADTASTKASEASQSATNAQTYASNAESAKTDAQTAQGLAESARDSAVQAKTDTESAKADAESARDEAQQAVASISGALAEKAPVITDTASGAIASFTDGADNLPLKSLVVNIDPVQDLHGYDSPWVGGGRKNLFQTTAQSKTENGVTWTVNDDGTITVSGTATGYTDLVVGYARVSSDMGVVTISGISTATNIAWASLTVRDVNDNVLYTITVGAITAVWSCDLSQYPEAYSIRVLVKRNNNVVTSGTVKIQVEKGSTATDWTPYENICPISGWTEVGVEQSGVNVWDEEWEFGIYSLSDGLPVPNASSIREKNRIVAKPSTDYYCNNNNIRVLYYDESDNYLGFVAGLGIKTTPTNCAYIRMYLGNDYGTTYNHDVCINYPSTDHSYHPYTGRSITISLGQTVYGGKLDVLSGKLTVYPYYASYNGEALTGRWISDRDAYAVGTTPTIGAQVVNIGAQGVTVQLEPHEVESLYGANNLWADSGDTEVEYRADTKLFIERLTAPDSADMIADANIASGQYFMVGNNLFKATANIANGSDIVVGTNCIRKSLSEALNEINA